MPHVLLYSLDGREVSSKGAKAQRMNLPFAPLRLCVSIVSATLLSILLLGERAVGDEATSFDELQKQYGDQIHQILKQFCLDCHSTEKQEGELDLQRFAAIADVRRDVKAWQKVAEMLDNGEMPVGSIVVKTSWQDEAGAPSTISWSKLRVGRASCAAVAPSSRHPAP